MKQILKFGRNRFYWIQLAMIGSSRDLFWIFKYLECIVRSYCNKFKLPRLSCRILFMFVANLRLVQTEVDVPDLVMATPFRCRSEPVR
jgi:hypothetical protein